MSKHLGRKVSQVQNNDLGRGLIVELHCIEMVILSVFVVLRYHSGILITHTSGWTWYYLLNLYFNVLKCFDNHEERYVIDKFPNFV